jgi:hypothetical protein
MEGRETRDDSGLVFGPQNCTKVPLFDILSYLIRATKKEGRLTKKKTPPRTPALPTAFDQARDELFSHILRCGVLDAAAEHQKEWIDDTMQYITERYTDLSPEQVAQVRVLGERFCQPVVRREAVGAGEA